MRSFAWFAALFVVAAALLTGVFVTVETLGDPPIEFNGPAFAYIFGNAFIAASTGWLTCRLNHRDGKS